ncbi:MAG: protein kinase [Myxococcales bacterium]|nr:protein kinase [Myxococcales bacterium]
MLRKLEKYEILSEIGHGGMATVYRARDSRLDREVAIKILHPHLRGADEARARFTREARSVARLRHPNILEIYDNAEESSDESFIVTELLTGPTLKAFVESTGAMPAEVAACFGVAIARALGAAHGAGIVHRDVKPENLLVDSSGTVKILDMGLARIREDSPRGTEGTNLTSSGQIMGTIDYISPEQAEDTRTADHRSDIYSLGCTLFRLLTNESVFPGSTKIERLMAHAAMAPPSLCEKRQDAPAELDAIVQKMLAKDPNERFQSMAEVSDALGQMEGAYSNSVVATVGQAGDAKSDQSDSGLTHFFAKLAVGAPAARPQEARPSLVKTLPLRQSPIAGSVSAILRGGAASVAIAAVGVLGLALGGVWLFVITIDRGEDGVLVIEANDDAVEVAVLKEGRIVQVADKDNQWQLNIVEGKYDIELHGRTKDKFQIRDQHIEVKRGKKTLVVVESRPVIARTVRRFYVDSTANEEGDGASWQSAFRSLQTALHAAAESPATTRELWVASGVYTPAAKGGDRDAAFIIPSGLAVYGGFLGHEATLGDRDLDAGESVLSGDLDQNDSGLSMRKENSYHVVVMEDANATTVLDGFTITGGAASGEDSRSDWPRFNGGGLMLRRGEPLIRNCKFLVNSARSDGGALAVRDCGATIEDCVFSKNRSHLGGAIDNKGEVKSGKRLTFIRCTFESNIADGGGAANCRFGIPTSFYNCRFSGNLATSANVYYGGGAVRCDTCELKIVNCVFDGNKSQRQGGAIDAKWRPFPQIGNCTFVNNEAPKDKGGAVFAWNSAHPRMHNCIVWKSGESPLAADEGNVPTSYCCVEGGWSGTGNIDTDPLFMDPENGDFRLRKDSPCIDIGSLTHLPLDEADIDGDGVTDEQLPLDLRGNKRILGKVDLGAIEFHDGPNPQLLPIDAAAGNWIDILQQIDLAKHQVFGPWRRQGNHLISGNMYFARVCSPFLPTGSYEVRTRFQTHSRMEELDWLLPVGDTVARVSIGRQIASIGDFGYESITEGLGEHRIALEREHEVLISVAHQNGVAQIRVSLDGTEIVAWRGRLSDSRPRSDWMTPDRTIGFGSHQLLTTLTLFELRPLTGQIRRIQVVEDGEVATGKWTDVLQLIDPETHAVLGQWRSEKDGVSVRAVEFSRIAIPVKPLGSYAFKGVVNRRGSAEVMLHLPVGDRACVLLIGTVLHRLIVVEPDSPATKSSTVVGPQFTFHARISHDEKTATIEIDLDDKPAMRWTGPLTAFYPRFDWVLNPRSLGVGAHGSTATFSELQLLVTEGDSPILKRISDPLD